MENINFSKENGIVLAGDFLFDSTQEVKGDKHLLKQKSAAKRLEYDLCGIWKIRNPTIKTYTCK